MNIITEFDHLILSDKANRLLSKLKEFVYIRLKVLEEEIEKEGGEIVIRIIPSGIEYQNFSQALLEKMNNCITAQDFMYASTKIMTEESSE